MLIAERSTCYAASFITSPRFAHQLLVTSIMSPDWPGLAELSTAVTQET